MSKEIFITEVERFVNQLSDEAKAYFEEFKTSKVGVPKAITDKGKIILKDMQENETNSNNIFKSKDIGERIGVSGRSVSGSIRALIALGYVEKNGADPVTYGLTDLGRDFSVDN